MKTQEEFLEPEIEVFESAEFQADFNQLSVDRKNDILFKRLLFDYDEDLHFSLKKFIRSNGDEPSWEELTGSYPELKYVVSGDSAPLSIAQIVLKEITLY
jgi:hypothetical protein